MNVGVGIQLTYTRCAGESTTISTPTPTADCKFWDEGWGWSFQVYNIKNWNTGDEDVEDRLHDEENGCGALTGWEFNNENSSGGEAWFNLPFFMKDGCVERAVKSAGGPKLGCDDQGFGKRDLEAKLMEEGESAKNKQGLVTPASNFGKETRKDRRLADNTEATAGNVASKSKRHGPGSKPPPEFDDPEIAEAYNPTGTDLAKIEHSYHGPNWQDSRRKLKARGPIAGRNPPPNLDDPDVAAAYKPHGVELSSVEHSYRPAQWSDKHTRGLHRLKKRGCFPSKIRPTSPAAGNPVAAPAPPVICEPILPGVDECNDQIRARGNVGPKISLFYTGLVPPKTARLNTTVMLMRLS